MNLLMLAALKMAYDQNQAIARRHRRAREEAIRNKKAPKSTSSSYSSKEYSEEEYFNMVVTEDPILTTFFKELERKGAEIDEHDAEEIRKVVEEKLKLQAERVDKIQKQFDKIKASGLDIGLTDTYFAYQTTVGQKVLDSGTRAFGDKGEYANVRKSFDLEYKGIPLSKEWFTGDKKKENPFETRYNTWYENNSDLEERIAAQEELVRAQERKVKFALFGKEEKEEELDAQKITLEVLQREKADGEELKRKSDIFAEITPEQKDMLEKYYEMVDECKVAGKEIDTEISNYNSIKSDSYNYSYRRKDAQERNKWQRTLDSLIESGEASEELLDAIDTIISEENIGYKKYSEGKDDYSMQRAGFSKNFLDAVSWYLETRKERIATKALHRKEEAYKALSVEHKKLCEMAGLVDEAQEIENSGNGKKGVDSHDEHGDE